MGCFTEKDLVADRLHEYDEMIMCYKSKSIKKLELLLKEIDRETVTLNELNEIALRAMQG